ncbi:MAG TPA: DUF5652 family protein [Patescibacteria group bacterium]|nr:DUF5652 family protein [Patescibacteria group bacterium]
MQYPIWFYLLGAWSLFWKGIALWRCSHNKQKIWFVILLVINTFGILELVYLFKFATKPLTFDEMKTWRNALSDLRSKNK